MQPISAATGSVSIGPTNTIGQLINGGVFDRFPKLKIYFAETHVGWIPFWMNKMDEFYARYYKFHGLDLKKMPSEYVRDHCRFSFVSARESMPLRYLIGLDLMMWGSDFPHSVGTFPDTREILTDLFENVPEGEKRKVLVENPCEFFDLDLEKELTPTP